MICNIATLVGLLCLYIWHDDNFHFSPLENKISFLLWLVSLLVIWKSVALPVYLSGLQIFNTWAVAEFAASVKVTQPLYSLSTWYVGSYLAIYSTLIGPVILWFDLKQIATQTISSF